MSQQATSDNRGADHEATSRPTKKEEAAMRMKAFKNKLQGFAKKTVDSTKKFVKETQDEITVKESIGGFLSTAIGGFQGYIKQKADTTDKNKNTKEIDDSIKFSFSLSSIYRCCYFGIFDETFLFFFVNAYWYNKKDIKPYIFKNHQKFPRKFRGARIEIYFCLYFFILYSKRT